MLPYEPDLDAVSANGFTPLILALHSSPMIDDGTDDAPQEGNTGEETAEGPDGPPTAITPGTRLKMLPMFAEIIKSVRVNVYLNSITPRLASRSGCER